MIKMLQKRKKNCKKKREIKNAKNTVKKVKEQQNGKKK